MNNKLYSYFGYITITVILLSVNGCGSKQKTDQNKNSVAETVDEAKPSSGQDTPSNIQTPSGWPEGLKENDLRKALMEDDIDHSKSILTTEYVIEPEDLLLAVYMGREDMVIEMLKNGADPNGRPTDPDIKFGILPNPTPLILAAYKDYYEIASILLEAGAYSYKWINEILWDEKNEIEMFDPDAKQVAIKYSTSISQLLDYDKLIIINNQIWVRSEPSTGDVVMKLDEGTECKVLEKGKQETIKGLTDNWYKIEFKGQTGWVFGSQTTKRRLMGVSGKELLEKVMLSNLGWPAYNSSFFDQSRSVRFPIDYLPFRQISPLTITRPGYDGDAYGITGDLGGLEDDKILFLDFAQGQAHGGMSCENTTLVAFKTDEAWIPAIYQNEKGDQNYIPGTWIKTLELTGDDTPEYIFCKLKSVAGAILEGSYYIFSINSETRSIKELFNFESFEYDLTNNSYHEVDFGRNEDAFDGFPLLVVLVIEGDIVGESRVVNSEKKSYYRWNESAGTFKELEQPL